MCPGQQRPVRTYGLPCASNGFLPNDGVANKQARVYGVRVKLAQMVTGVCSVDNIFSVTCLLQRVRLRQRECMRALQTAPPPKDPEIETSGSK